MVQEESEVWQCPDCATRVDISTLGFFDQVACPSCSKIVRVHKRIDHFELKKIIGIGGMSVVLEAYDTLLDRTVAIKILNAGCRHDPERSVSFEKECKLLARVQHPTVVKVYTAGHVRGYFYFAMELLEGQNLEFSVRGRTSTHPFVMLKMAHLIASGLKAAREMGVLHRDLKPGNILLTSEGEAKLIDFGLAIALGEHEESETIWATPFYAAPETLMQQPEDERADIYSLGMTMRSILTMKDIFSHVVPPKDSAAWYAGKMSLPSIALTLPTLEKEICRLIDHMTSFDIAARPQNYDELIHEIEDAMEVMQARVSGQYPWQRFQKYLYTSGSVAVLTLLLSLLPLGSLFGGSSAAIADSSDPAAFTDGQGEGVASSRALSDTEAQKLAKQLLRDIHEPEYRDLVTIANHLSYRDEAPLVQLWSMQLRWVIAYLESGEDDLLAGLERAILEKTKQLSSQSSSSKLREDLLYLAAMITTRKKTGESDAAYRAALGTENYAMHSFARIAQLRSMEARGDYARALAILDELESTQKTQAAPRALLPQLALTRHRLSQHVKAHSPIATSQS